MTDNPTNNKETLYDLFRQIYSSTKVKSDESDCINLEREDHFDFDPDEQYNID